MSVLPNFLVIGTQRGGTSWLWKCLAGHPDVCVAGQKEVHFFDQDENWAKGVQWYCQQFGSYSGEKAVGEATPSYMWHDDAPDRMARVVPSANLIVILRDPVDRAYSNYWRRRRYGEIDPSITFEEAVEVDPEYISRGLYYRQLKRILELFSNEQLLVLFFDQIRRDPQELIKEVYNFVDVNYDYVPSWLDRSYNAAIYPRVLETMRRLRLEWLIQFVKSTELGDYLRRTNAQRKTGTYPAISSKTKSRLRARFREDGVLLEGLIRRKVPWVSQ